MTTFPPPLEPRLQTAIKAFALEVQPIVEEESGTVRHVRFQDGLVVNFGRVVITLSDDYDSTAFASDFYNGSWHGDRYAYDSIGLGMVRQNIAEGWIPVRLDVWSRQGRKSKPAKPVRLDVWFVTKHDTVNRNATRYKKTRPADSVGHSGRYEGNTW